ncbi:DUF4871 domain-containing protein [Metabacillus litoralis]|uniref:DUF4871 domain-containing protein n=1 Tax=Metabacillus litoralis TaxID=152268 RepID=UPI002041FF5C|nr:DUF4871 domain-containing protein [Metabacillus litoralis]MCM3412685.1 DUF4871 domain-containing protein [Metabacillus litoralis]
MKLKIFFTAFLLSLFIISGCESSKVHEVQNTNNFSLPKDIPSFVTGKDFENIDWNRTVIEFNTSERSDMVGNKDKLGIIGPELKPKEVEKWLWHFWGIDTGDITVVGYNLNASMISPVLSDGTWSRDGIGGMVNGADASMPSNVSLPEAGKWAILVYIDGKFFDALVIDVKDE